MVKMDVQQIENSGEGTRKLTKTEGEIMKAWRGLVDFGKWQRAIVCRKESIVD